MLHSVIFRIVFSLLIYGLSFVQPAAAQAPLPVQKFEIWRDDGQTAWPAVAQQPFQPLTQDSISLGISDDSYWIRFRLPDNPAARRQILQLDNGNIDRLDVYLPHPRSGQYRHFELGTERPAANKDVRCPGWAFRVRAGSDYVYLRLSSTAALRLPVLLWSEDAFWQETSRQYVAFSLFYGLLLTAGLFYLFIFRALRDKAYLYYCLYVGGMLLYQLQVQGHARLLLDYPHSIGNIFFWLTLGATFIASLLFAVAFLQLDFRQQRWRRWLYFLGSLAALQGLFGAFSQNIAANQLAHLLGVIGPMTMIALAIQRLRQGFLAARFFLAAWSILFIAILTWVLSAYLPLPRAAAHVLPLATACEILLLALALADRLKLLQDKQKSLQQRMHHFQQLSLTDELTGLYNKRCFQTQLADCLQFALQNRLPLSMLILDLDSFKQYNDTYGHWEGDQVLARLGRSMRERLRDCDSAFRYGGEEFIALLPAAALEQALEIAERIRCDFAAQTFRPRPELAVSVTLSIGVAELRNQESAADFFKRADDALYQAKRTGRNRSICA